VALCGERRREAVTGRSQLSRVHGVPDPGLHLEAKLPVVRQTGAKHYKPEQRREHVHTEYLRRVKRLEENKNSREFFRIQIMRTFVRN